MTDNERKSIRSIMFERQELAFERIKNKPSYLEVCQRQRQAEEIVEKMYHERFTQEERIIIRRHYEGEVEKIGMEENEVYFQGLRDCFQLIVYLGLLID